MNLMMFHSWGFARSKTLYRTHPHRTPWWKVAAMMAWWFRMVVGDAPATFIWPYGSSRSLIVSWVSLSLPSRGPSAPSTWDLSCRMMVGERSSRSHSRSHSSSSWPTLAPAP